MPTAWASRAEVRRTCSPKMEIWPESGRTRPESSFIVVDLPAPFSPSRAWTVPRSTEKLTSLFATVGP